MRPYVFGSVMGAELSIQESYERAFTTFGEELEIHHVIDLNRLNPPKEQFTKTRSLRSREERRSRHLSIGEIIARYARGLGDYTRDALIAAIKQTAIYASVGLLAAALIQFIAARSFDLESIFSQVILDWTVYGKFAAATFLVFTVLNFVGLFKRGSPFLVSGPTRIAYLPRGDYTAYIAPEIGPQTIHFGLGELQYAHGKYGLYILNENRKFVSIIDKELLLGAHIFDRGLYEFRKNAEWGSRTRKRLWARNWRGGLQGTPAIIVEIDDSQGSALIIHGAYFESDNDDSGEPMDRCKKFHESLEALIEGRTLNGANSVN